jgi:hypothetical protein
VIKIKSQRGTEMLHLGRLGTYSQILERLERLGPGAGTIKYYESVIYRKITNFVVS